MTPQVPQVRSLRPPTKYAALAKSIPDFAALKKNECQQSQEATRPDRFEATTRPVYPAKKVASSKIGVFGSKLIAQDPSPEVHKGHRRNHAVQFTAAVANEIMGRTRAVSSRVSPEIDEVTAQPISWHATKSIQPTARCSLPDIARLNNTAQAKALAGRQHMSPLAHGSGALDKSSHMWSAYKVFPKQRAMQRRASAPDVIELASTIATAQPPAATPHQTHESPTLTRQTRSASAPLVFISPVVPTAPHNTPVKTTHLLPAVPAVPVNTAVQATARRDDIEVGYITPKAVKQALENAGYVPKRQELSVSVREPQMQWRRQLPTPVHFTFSSSDALKSAERRLTGVGWRVPRRPSPTA